MKFGKYDIIPVETGRMHLDGGAMFGVVPKNLWCRTNPPDEKNRIAMAAKALLIQTKDRKILVDTGVGNKVSDKFRNIYGIDFSEYSLESSLRDAGVSPNEITDVILTHLHFDHVGGAIKNDGEQFSLTFPSATHYVQKAQWDWALNPSDRDRASYLPENFLPIYDSGKLVILDGPETLFEGVDLVLVNGHTFGQQLVRVTQDGLSLLYCGDLIPMSAHVPAAYIMGYDLQPLVTLSEKKQILESALEKKDVLFFEHDTHVDAAQVTKDARGFFMTNSGKLDSVMTTSMNSL